MTSTVFTPYVTPVPSTWLNDINNHTYNNTPISPATTVHPANVVSYTPAGTGAVATTVQSKLRESVSITDFGGDLQLAVSASSYVKIPAGVTCIINSDINIPNGSVIQHDGLLQGIGRLLPAGSFTMFGTGIVTSTRSGGYVVNLVAGDIVIDGITFTDGGGTFQIGVIPTTTITSLSITRCKFFRTNYAILRNASTGNVTSAIVSGNQFRDIGNNQSYGGEPIEWNLGPTDSSLIISNNVINNVNGNQSSQGIAIGVAGATPSSTSPQMHDFIISNNVIYGSRQGIHVESADKFIISGNSCRNISASYGVTGLVVAGIVVYGGTEVVIEGNYSDSQISAGCTVNGATYTESPTNIVIRNNTGTTIGTVAAGDAKYVTIENNKTTSISHSGGIRYLNISANYVNTAAKTVGLTIDYNADVSPISGSPVNNVVSIKNNTVVDTLGRAYVTITSLPVKVLECSGNNFNVTSSLSNRKWSNRTLYKTSSGTPYGIEFQVGDLIIETVTPARYICTVAGSLNRGVDNFTTTTVAGSTFEVKTTNLPWGNGQDYHEQGQSISLSNIGPASATLNTRVIRCYISGSSEYILVLEDAWSTAGTGTITATTPATLVTI